MANLMICLQSVNAFELYDKLYSYRISNVEFCMQSRYKAPSISAYWPRIYCHKKFNKVTHFKIQQLAKLHK